MQRQSWEGNKELSMSDSKIKVLMVGPDRGVHGGISAIVNNYYEAGLDKRVDLKYIGTMKEGSRGKKLLVAATAYFKFLCSLGWCDVVHVNASSDSSIMRKSFFIRAAYRRNKKIVFHQHGGDFVNYFENQISEKRRRYLRRILDMSDVMLVLTPTWKEFFSGLTDEGKIRVFPNSIVTEGEVSENFAASHDLRKILFLGRICRDKGISELLEAVDEIHEEDKDVVLYIGGIYEEPEYKAELEKRSSYVKHIGWVQGKDKNKYLSECGIMAVPSYFEGFGMTVIEGMYSGLVVVGSEVGGIPDIIRDGEDGILIPPKDAKALKNAMLRVMNDNSLAEKLRVSGHKKVEENYSAGVSVERLVNIYNSLV